MNINETNLDGRSTCVHGIHQNLSQVKKSLGTCCRPLDTPPALIKLVDYKRMSGAALGSHPSYILSKVANLIESVPDGHLQVAFGTAGRNEKSHFDQMFRGVVKRNNVSDRSAL